MYQNGLFMLHFKGRFDLVTFRFGLVTPPLNKISFDPINTRHIALFRWGIRVASQQVLSEKRLTLKVTRALF
jgi:hypothetical protein